MSCDAGPPFAVSESERVSTPLFFFFFPPPAYISRTWGGLGQIESRGEAGFFRHIGEGRGRKVRVGVLLHGVKGHMWLTFFKGRVDYIAAHLL